MSNASVYDELRAAIATGEILPNERLIESELMERFDAGRPSVRIALIRLEQEGLVEQERGHSARVRLIGRDEAVEISEARALLESYATAAAAERATDADIDELRTLVEKSDSLRDAGRVSELVDIDTRFHQKILEISANRTIMRLNGALHGHLVRHHRSTQLEQERSGASPQEHRAIVDAIAAHNPVAASTAMQTHLDRLTQVLRQVLDSL
jgi:DNA-binding GntR family transcriptional regulator